jgi:alpha-1,3/alpha-1,6-mannosyltransferase
MRIAILHPELGIGGAERLIVDAALALQERGHQVTIHTAFRDPAHCFGAACDGRLDVHVHAPRLPLAVRGRLRLPAAIARMRAVCRAALRTPADVIVCDVMSHIVPLLRRRTRAPILFYGHYPDLYLTPPRRGWYHAYRLPLDYLEERGLRAAHHVLVNSAYTAAAFRTAFPRLPRAPEVLHPSVAVHASAADAPPSRGAVIAVIGRLVPGKNLLLAVDAFAELRRRLAPARFAALRLVIAGAYDRRLGECAEALQQLRARCAAHGVAAQVEVRCSPSDGERDALLRQARCVLFTPLHEHFGYVPVEAMAAGRPVVATDCGGPTETVRDGETGFLCAPTAAAFAAALQRLIDDPDLADRFGAAGRARAAAHFSLAAFGNRLDAVLRALHERAAFDRRDR